MTTIGTNQLFAFNPYFLLYMNYLVYICIPFPFVRYSYPLSIPLIQYKSISTNMFSFSSFFSVLNIDPCSLYAHHAQCSLKNLRRIILQFRTLRYCKFLLSLYLRYPIDLLLNYRHLLSQSVYTKRATPCHLWKSSLYFYLPIPCYTHTRVTPC